MAPALPPTNSVHGRHVALFVVIVWLALVTTLLSSVLPGGLPRTTAVGSAFDPSTTAVALRPNIVHPKVVLETGRPDDDRASGQGIAIARTAPVALLMTSLGPMRVSTQLRDAGATSYAIFDGTPRGPPLT